MRLVEKPMGRRVKPGDDDGKAKDHATRLATDTGSANLSDWISLSTVIAGLDPATHWPCNSVHGGLGLHHGEPDARHALHRRDERPSAPGLGAPRGADARLRLEIRVQAAGLVGGILLDHGCDRPREIAQEMAAGVENRSGGAGQSPLARLRRNDEHVNAARPMGRRVEPGDDDGEAVPGWCFARPLQTREARP